MFMYEKFSYLLSYIVDHYHSKLTMENYFCAKDLLFSYCLACCDFPFFIEINPYDRQLDQRPKNQNLDGKNLIKCSNHNRNNNYKFSIKQRRSNSSITFDKIIKEIIPPKSIINIFILNLLLLIISSLSSLYVSAATDHPKGDTFSIDKLLEYNELVSCFGQMHKEFEQCNKKGAEKAKSFLGQIELSQEWNKRLKCCGTWKLRDCWMKAARQKCTKIQADMVYKLPDLIMPSLVEECQDYTPESGKCALPIWLIVAVLTTIGFILMTCCCSVIYCIRRRHRKQRYRRRGLPPPGQRSYSMTQQKSISYQNMASNQTKMNGTSHHNHNNHNHYHHQNSHRISCHHSTTKMSKETLDNVDSEELKTLNPLTANLEPVNKVMEHHQTSADNVDGETVIAALV